jgi:hypothetical protein
MIEVTALSLVAFGFACFSLGFAMATTVLLWAARR